MRGICAHEGGKSGFWTKNKRGAPTKKAGKSPNKATCVYEGAYVHMKGKSQGFWTKNDRGPPTKKAGKSTRKKQLVFMKGHMCT